VPLSLRHKLALGMSALALLLLALEAISVRAFAEAHEDDFINGVIADDMQEVLRQYKEDPARLPKVDKRLGMRLSHGVGQRINLPDEVSKLADGTHEIVVDGKEIHVAITPLAGTRLIRVYDYSAYEARFKRVLNLIMGGTAVFAALGVWFAFHLSGVLVRQITQLAGQVRTLGLRAGQPIDPTQYDENEVAQLAHSVNAYHERMDAMVEREKQFTANVSHELRTPLTAISTSCELLVDDPAIAGKSRVRLKQIGRAASSIRERVEALLLLARSATPAETELLRLTEVLEAVIDSVASKVPVENSVDRSVWIEANRSALRIVLANILDNAVRHTEQGQIRLGLENRELVVQDSGCGIEPAALPHVFDRFYRAGKDGVAAHGFGLGLAIVKDICDHHGWSIRIASEPGAGTRIMLGLPFTHNRVS
jgi:signal transduction histidine kinase